MKPLLPLYAYYRGINYLDTAESYPLHNQGAAETALSKGLIAQVPAAHSLHPSTANTSSTWTGRR